MSRVVSHVICLPRFSLPFFAVREILLVHIQGIEPALCVYNLMSARIYAMDKATSSLHNESRRLVFCSPQSWMLRTFVLLDFSLLGFGSSGGGG